MPKRPALIRLTARPASKRSTAFPQTRSRKTPGWSGRFFLCLLSNRRNRIQSRRRRPVDSTVVLIRRFRLTYDLQCVEAGHGSAWHGTVRNKPKIKRKSHRKRWLLKCIGGRGERIRTSDFYLPKVALYQAELHPDAGLSLLTRECAASALLQRAAHDNGQPPHMQLSRRNFYSAGTTVIFTRMRSPGSNGRRAM